MALLTAANAPAATVTITDCGASPVEKVGKRTVISRSADDVTIQCALLPLAGTTRIEITARSLVVDGAQGGSIVAAGKGLAIEIVTTGTNADDRSVALTRTTLTAANPNGDVEISGPSVSAATCKIANATLLDDEPDLQPSLQCTVQGQATQLGSCDARR